MSDIKNNEEFIDEELNNKDCKIIAITEQLITERLHETMTFVNTIRAELSETFGWGLESTEYFINPMDRKYKYSYMVINKRNEILSMNFSSVYTDRLHLHCMYTRSDFRKSGFAKLILLKVCQKGIEDGFKEMGGFWPKKNNGSIILFLRLGMTISYLRNDVELFLTGNLDTIENKAKEIYLKEKRTR